MKANALILIVLICASVCAQDLPEYSQNYDPARNAFVDFKQALTHAKKHNKLVLLEFGGDWCKWCHRLDAFFAQNKKMKEQLHDVFVVVKINVSEENPNEEFLSHLPEIIAYPHFFIADSDGHVIASQDVFVFEDRGAYSKRLFRQFIDQWAEASQAILALQNE